jgi:hypothetical protein
MGVTTSRAFLVVCLFCFFRVFWGGKGFEKHKYIHVAILFLAFDLRPRGGKRKRCTPLFMLSNSTIRLCNCVCREIDR